MIVLIITLPFYTASIFADSRLEVQIYGKDGAEGYRQKTDKVIIKATTFYSEQGAFIPINPDNLLINPGPV